ncbi:MAG TPA: DinB family protein [Bryobacteraceae bacterium]|nr:DinB family protein [Bryobacteraceae bacterium]
MSANAPLPEPWLRGPLPGVHPLLTPVLFAFQQAREDLARATESLTAGQLWMRPHGLTPAGFHLRHIAGSVDRLMTYLQNRELTPEQMAELAAERRPGAGREELLAAVEQSLGAAEGVVRALDPATLAEPRTVGRKRLPTTVIGLLTHIAEHTLRHVGQTVTTTHLIRNTPSTAPAEPSAAS